MKTTLRDALVAGGTDAGLLQVLTAVASACVDIGRVVSGGALAGGLGDAGAVNVQGEHQKKLDVIANDLLSTALHDCAPVAGFASEELDEVEPTGRHGAYLVTFDPLDGSSNIDVNVTVGTIFSVLAAPKDAIPTETDFLQPGRRQVAAGYVTYGPQTMLVVTVGDHVDGFTLDPAGEWRLTHPGLRVPAKTAEFAINASNYRHWAAPVRAYVDDCLAGTTGPRGKNFNMRWVASMVADVHRIMMRGGVFLYPWDQREPNRPGKLRLLYEAAPMSLLIERAGGAATDGKGARILDVTPTKLHQRAPVVLGSRNEVAVIDAFGVA